MSSAALALKTPTPCSTCWLISSAAHALEPSMPKAAKEATTAAADERCVAMSFPPARRPRDQAFPAGRWFLLRQRRAGRIAAPGVAGENYSCRSRDRGPNWPRQFLRLSLEVRPGIGTPLHYKTISRGPRGGRHQGDPGTAIWSQRRPELAGRLAKALQGRR